MLTAAIAPLVGFSPSLSGGESTASSAGTRAVSGLKIRLGVVGCGGRGAWIARLFHQHGGFEIRSVADYYQEVAEACGNALGVDRSRCFSGLSGFKKVIESGVEAVALETPPFFFPEHVQAAVDAGLHVYMAKPVAVDVPGCLKVEACAQKATASNHCFMVDYQIPTDPHNLMVAKMIRQGDIGGLTTLNSHYFAGSFADPPKTSSCEDRLQKLIWVNDVSIGGGYHVNACIHAIDGALWIAGQRPGSAMGVSRLMRAQPHGDSHDVFSLLFEFSNGLVLNHRGKHLNNQTGFNVVCEVQGQTGYAQVNYGGKAFLKGPENAYEGEVANLYEAGAVRNIATFHQDVIQQRYENPTIKRSIDGALATILGREAARRHDRMSLEELLRENRRLEVDLSGLKT
jgi:predicted dehydrogenase